MSKVLGTVVKKTDLDSSSIIYELYMSKLINFCALVLN